MLVSLICCSSIDAFSKDLYIEWKWSFEFPYGSPHVSLLILLNTGGGENGIIPLFQSKDFKKWI